MAQAFRQARFRSSRQQLSNKKLTSRKSAVICHAKQACQPLEAVKRTICTAGAAVLLSIGGLSAQPALASEFEVLTTPVPTDYFIDDASVLNKITRAELNKRLKLLDITEGYRLEVITMRKLEFETDPFAYADKVLESWYPTPEQGDKKGILLVVTTSKDGAVTGGKSFVEAVGEDLIDSVVNNNIPIYTELERYNETVISAVDRLEAKLSGKPVPDGPERADTTRKRTYKTKEETDSTRSVTGTIVLTLLGIAVVVPMLQYYGYTARD